MRGARAGAAATTGAVASPCHGTGTALPAPCTPRAVLRLPWASCPHSPPQLTATVQVPPEPGEPSGTRSLSGATLSAALIPLKTNYYQPRQKVNTSNISLSLWTHGNPIHLSLSFNPSQQGTEENTQRWGLPRQGVLVGFQRCSHIPFIQNLAQQNVDSVLGSGGNPKGAALVTKGCGRSRGSKGSSVLQVVLRLLCPVISQHSPTPFPGCSQDQLLPHRIPAGRSNGQSRWVPAEPAPAPSHHSSSSAGMGRWPKGSSQVQIAVNTIKICSHRREFGR